jgi:4-hydroxybenzoate polyprenyltransferase
MFRLLVLLQLTRAALAFTAIADAWTVLLLYPHSNPDMPPSSHYGPYGFWFMVLKMLLMSVVSAGLYGFGMSLNDLMDMRRDRIFAKWRPLPSGRISPRSAIVVAILLLMASLSAAAGIGAVDIAFSTERVFVPWSVIFAMATAVLIVFYDATAKYLGGIGLVTLGAIRAFHCLIANPKTPLLFLSMVLLTHIITVSLIGYRMEGKRPRLQRADWIICAVGIAVGNLLALGYMYARHTFSLQIGQMLIGPAVAMVLYVAWAAIYLRMRRDRYNTRQKGERLVLMGLFWLFVYDASILFANNQVLAGIAVTVLLVCAILSFFSLRRLGRYMSQPKLGYRRERGLAPADT